MLMMMISSSSAAMKVHFFLFLLLLPCFSFFADHPFVHGDDVLDWNHIYNYCEKTTLPVLCGSCMLIQTGLALPKVGNTLQSMIVKVLRCANYRALSTRDNLHDTYFANTTDPNNEPIDKCGSSIGKILPSWIAAGRALGAGKHDIVKIEIWKTQSYALRCLEIFQQYPNVPVPTRVLLEVLDYQTITHVITALVDQL